MTDDQGETPPPGRQRLTTGVRWATRALAVYAAGTVALWTMTVHRLPTCPGGGADLVQRPETADAMLAIALLCAFVLQLISCWSRPPVRGRAWAVGLLVEFAVLGVSVWAGIANMACISVAGVRLMRVVDGSV